MSPAALACILLSAGAMTTRPAPAPAPAPVTLPAIVSDKPVSPVIDPITVERVPPTVQRITFDRAHPPPSMRTMHADESAFTQYDFNCAVHVKYDIVRQTRRDGQVEVVARIHAVQVKLTLEDRIYVPDNANVPLRAHEEGHREINEHVFDTAEPIARELATKIMQKDWSASGADADQAGKHATDAAVKELCDEYLEQIAGRATRVGQFYDEITAHGTRPIAITKAIQQAFERDLDRGAATATSATQ
jgi:hypothetical protein